MSEQPVNREEVEQHVKAYSDAWKDFDDVETGTTFLSASEALRELEKDRINLRFTQARQWLWEHGIPDDRLEYDQVTRTYRLPADWTPTPGT